VERESFQLLRDAQDRVTFEGLVIPNGINLVNRGLGARQLIRQFKFHGRFCDNSFSDAGSPEAEWTHR
jgi:hypothetical protein